jgi:DNA-binding transcriptional LysR family regulator
VNDRLEAVGQTRRVALTVNDARSAVRCAANSDLVATVPECVASEAVAAGEVVAIAPPFDLPPVEFYLWWHSRVHDDVPHMWWRNTVLSHLPAPPKCAVRH